MDYISLLNAGCPVGRHELRNEEWIWIGILLKEREKIAVEEAKERTGK